MAFKVVITLSDENNQISHGIGVFNMVIGKVVSKVGVSNFKNVELYDETQPYTPLASLFLERILIAALRKVDEAEHENKIKAVEDRIRAHAKLAHLNDSDTAQ